MRKSIRELFPKRQQVKQTLEQLNVVVDWMQIISTCATCDIQIEHVIIEA